MLYFIAVPLFAGLLAAQTAERPVRAVTDPGVITTRQNITPAGVQMVFQGRTYGAAFGKTASEVWLLNAGQVYRLDWRANRVLERIPLAASPGLQAIRYDAATGRVLVSGADRKAPGSPKVRLFTVENGSATPLGAELGGYISGSLAVGARANSAGRRIAVVPLIAENRVAVLDVGAGTMIGKWQAGVAPFGVVLDAAGTVAYVSNWGGRIPTATDLTAPTGLAPDSDRAVVDRRGIASTGTVTRIDASSGAITHTIAVGLHPTAMAWDEPRNRLYVANGNDDSVSVIDTRENRVVRTIPVQPFRQKVAGVAPTALILSPDGATLFVACGGINAVAVLSAGDGRLQGLIPTAWYPNGLSLSPDGKYLAVSTLLGVGSGWREEPRKRFVHAYRGSLSVVPVPDEAQLAGYTVAVAENNHLLPVSAAPVDRPVRKAQPVAVPQRHGDPSPIEHVVYIIKENRTYDQVFGDIGKGNGDPSLVMFGAEVTPNQHRLAEQFVLLDNFYAVGGNSGDGHQWLTQANETDYAMWPGYTGRSYPFDGSDPIAYSNSGFIWDAALKAGKTVRVYGEYAGRLGESSSRQREELLQRWQKGDDFTRDWNIVAPIQPLNAILAKNYPPYSTAVPDVVRAQIFLEDVKKWSKEGRMPNFVIVQLPSNHTRGTAPGASTPKAMVADNDLALGQVIEELTKTPFWRKMAIFVVEDDAQNGVDHVDGHRTVALAVSPYTRRGHVDSTFYSQTSMVKTIELILGLPPLTLFDLIATPMHASFVNEPDYAGYTAITPEVSLFDVNPPLSALSGPARTAALDSMKMRFEVPDAAPSDKLNRILWHDARGWTTRYPGVNRAAFAPVTFDLDDDER
jgi:YVTN family beta-propeller protein